MLNVHNSVEDSHDAKPRFFGGADSDGVHASFGYHAKGKLFQRRVIRA